MQFVSNCQIINFFRCKLIGSEDIGQQTNGTYNGVFGLLQDKTADLFLYNLSPYVKKDFFEHSNPAFHDG